MRSLRPGWGGGYEFEQKLVEEGVSGADLFDCGDVFGEADAVIEVEGFVVLDVAEYLFLVVVNEDCVLLDLKAVDF
jgi:hypothetical protein